MPIFAIVGGLMALVVVWEPLFQILFKLTLWLMMWNSLGMAIKADVNYYAEKFGFERPYVLPLDPEVLLMQTPISYATKPLRETRDDQGRITGFSFGITGRLDNRTGRTLTGADFMCRWRNHPEDEDRSLSTTINFSVPPGQSYDFAYAFKTRDDRAPTDMADFLTNHRYNCRLTGVSEQKQEDWP